MKHVPRFYTAAELCDGGKVSLLPDQLRHATAVLRLSVGDMVRVFNSPWGEWICEIIDAQRGALKCISMLKKCFNETGPAVACTLINPKRFDFFLEKVTELGVSEIIPIVSQRSNYKNINLRKAEQKIIQACEQSQRLSIPTLREVMKLKDFLPKYSSNYRILVGDEKFSKLKLSDVIREKCVFLVGPEGGFTDEEYKLFSIYKDLHKFTIGSTILRSETAAISFVSVWRDKFS
ncbi:MAG: 16S rRNA (uracil(1498)-N(3))-methyltransferase [Holosporaceae bacterium]|jgi:16S rRNA (uracil1498-N3)-methyltransferase|nr:16S rRNA (uracil(1498)-N(3))-methyltransferase [Holosporaceae bacterium]